jgi:flagellar motor component MotA
METCMLHLHLTDNEARFLRDRMRLIVMNERGPDAIMAENVLTSMDERIPHRRPSNIFADLFPEGRE